MTMDQRRAQLSPVFEMQPALPSAPALVVQVEIQFTDPVIRSRYTRSYGSSPDFTASTKVCKGLLRRIERCSEELLTRKDSGALGMFKDGTFERKPLRYEIAFRISTREGGKWAERTYRSYQKQPLTVALTKDIIIASHRIVGLFLRRHDKGFRWLDGAVRDTSAEGPQTTSPSLDGPLSLLCVPRSRFIESTQSFEFVPGYTIELSFRNRDTRREVPVFTKVVRVNSGQAAPLTLFLSEDMLWQGLRVANQQLEPKKQEFDSHLKSCSGGDCHHSDDESLNIELRLTNNLGLVHDDIRRTIQSKFALFCDTDECDRFVQAVEAALIRIRDDTDAKINAHNDFELRIIELRGSGWSVRQPAVFNLDSSTSYGRRTIHAALDRVQTGVADVLRGYDVAVHISAQKRGHLILDKAIVAHAKRGIPKEVFSSPEDEQKIFTSRLKARIQQDIDKVFEDTCSIDDIPDEAQRSTSPDTVVGTEYGTPEKLRLDEYSPGELDSLPTTPIKNSPKPRAQRMFSLSSRRSPRTDTESLRSTGSTNDLRSNGDVFENRSTRAISIASGDVSSEGGSVLYEERPSLYVVSPTKPAQRRFPLVGKRYPSRVSNASTLIEEFQGGFEGSTNSAHGQHVEDTGNMKVEAPEAKRVPQNECAQALQKSGYALREIGDALNTMTRGEAETDDVNANARMNLVAEPRINLTDGSVSVSSPESQLGTKPNSQAQMDTPQIFEDAAEFVSATEIAEIANLKSPSPETEAYSTAPSTPGLSWGADSSPRHSISATPTDERIFSGTRGSSLRHFEPEPELEKAAMGAETAINEVSVRKAVDDDKDVHPRLCPAPQTAGPDSLRTLGSDVKSEPVGSEQIATETVPEPEATMPDPSDSEDTPASDGLSLGAERPNEPSEECGSPAPDYPTSNVREAATEKETSPISDTISAPEARGCDEVELGVDDAFGPANLWGLLAAAVQASEPRMLVDESLGPVDLWGILQSDGVPLTPKVPQETTLGAELLGPVTLWGILRNGETAVVPEVQFKSENRVEEPEFCADIETTQSEAVDTANLNTESAAEEPDLSQVPGVSVRNSVGQDRTNSESPSPTDGPEAEKSTGGVATVEIVDDKLDSDGDRDLASVTVGPAVESRDLETDGADDASPSDPPVAVGTELNENPTPEFETDVAETPEELSLPEVSDKNVIADATPDVQSDLHAVLPAMESLDASEIVVGDQIGENDSAVGLTISDAKDITEPLICNDTENASEIISVVGPVDDIVAAIEVDEPKAQAPDTEAGIVVAVAKEDKEHPEVQATLTNIQEETDGSREIEAEVTKEQEPSTSEILDDAAGFNGDSGSEMENLEPEVPDDKLTVAPEISVQDFAATVHELPLAIDDVALSNAAYNVGQQTSEATSDVSLLNPATIRGAPNPLYLSPSHAASPRSSMSSISVSDWSDIQSVVSNSRDSVETVYPAGHEELQRLRAQSPDRCQSRPQTAGFLGFGENRFAPVGLRGALGASRERRLSLPLQNIIMDKDTVGGSATSGSVTAVETPASSVAGDKVKKSRKRGILRSKKEEEEVVDDGPPVLPRVMMLLAGMVALGKVLKGSSH